MISFHPFKSFLKKKIKIGEILLNLISGRNIFKCNHSSLILFNKNSKTLKKEKNLVKYEIKL